MYVFSNASYYRMTPDVPLVIPEINWQHLGMLKTQQQAGWSGGIVCNTNCTVSGPVMSLKPLHDAFGVVRVFFGQHAGTFSGAGYPGVASLDGTENVVPFIKGEEEKQEAETRKLLGSLNNGKIDEMSIPVSAHCNRVPVIDGHMVTVSVNWAQRSRPKRQHR